MAEIISWFNQIDKKLKIIAGILVSIGVIGGASMWGYEALKKEVEEGILTIVMPVIEDRIQEVSKEKTDEILPILKEIGEDMKSVKDGMHKFDDWIELDIKRDMAKQVKKIKFEKENPNLPSDIKISDVENVVSDYEKLKIKDAKIKAQYEILFKWYKENM